MRRGEKKLWCCLGNARHSAQFIQITRLHIEMRRHALYKHALERLCLSCLLRQYHNICPKPLLKTHEPPLKSEQNLGAAEDHECEN